MTTEILRSLDEISLFSIFLIIFLSWGLIGSSQQIIPWLAERLPNRIRLYLLPVPPILRLIVILIAIIQLILEVIDPSLQNIWTIVAASGFAIGFAFKDYASSVLAGVVALIEHPYRVGDWVEIDGDYGELVSMNLRSFQIVTPDDSLITIPHSKIWDNNISSANDGAQNHMCVTHFYLHPQHDPDLVIDKLRDVASASAYLAPQKPINIIVEEKPGFTHYRLKAYPFDGRHQFDFITDLTVRGKKSLSNLDVKFAPLPVAINQQIEM